MKTFEIFFFLAFLGLFYVVSIQRDMENITVAEIIFYLFVLGFSIDECKFASPSSNLRSNAA